MKTSSDMFFQQGTTHTVCQDFALAGQAGNLAYAIVTDGCSGSANSDTGARILAYSAANLLPILAISDPQEAYQLYGDAVIRQARGFLLPGLERSSLDATLLVAVQLQDRFRVVVYGDGVVLTGRPEEARMIEFTQSAPFYLNYRGDTPRLDCYRMQQIQVRVNDGEPIDPERCSLVFDYPVTATDRVAVGSDGWLSFTNLAGEIKPFNTLGQELMAFKTTNGAFVQRRLRNGLLKNLARNGFLPGDDIAFAALIKE